MNAPMIDPNTIVVVIIGCTDAAERYRVTLGMFLEANAGDVDGEAIMAAVATGQTYRGGGGAAPEFTVRRAA